MTKLIFTTLMMGMALSAVGCSKDSSSVSPQAIQGCINNAPCAQAVARGEVAAVPGLSQATGLAAISNPTGSSVVPGSSVLPGQVAVSVPGGIQVSSIDPAVLAKAQAVQAQLKAMSANPNSSYYEPPTPSGATGTSASASTIKPSSVDSVQATNTANNINLPESSIESSGESLTGAAR